MQIEIFIKDTVHSGMKDFISDGTLYMPVTTDTMQDQCSRIGIKSVIHSGSYKEIPTSTSSDVFIILDSNNYISNKYIKNIVSLFSIYNCSLLFGAQYNRISKSEFQLGRLSNTFHVNSVELISKFTSCIYINGEPYNYPIINGCAFNSSIYNSIGGYKYCPGPRYDSEYNHNFMCLLDTYGKIVFTDLLKIYYNVDLYNSTELDLYRYYYDLGYRSFQKEIDRSVLHYDVFGGDKSIFKECLNLGYSESMVQKKIV